MLIFLLPLPHRQHFEGLNKLKESGLFKMGGESCFPMLSLLGCLGGPSNPREFSNTKGPQVPFSRTCPPTTRSRA